MASEEAQVKKEKAEKGERTFKELAIRNVSHARRAFANEEGDKTATAGHLMQSAVVYAILDLADAVRGGSDDAIPENGQLGIAGSRPPLRPT